MGGLAAVIVTDVAQSVVLLVGAACMCAVGFARVGGLAALERTPPASVSSDEWRTFFALYRPLSDPDYPSLGMLLGTNVGGLWYWCLDQAIVQRVLSARSLDHARASTTFAGFLKITPVFLMVFPGLVARRLFDAELNAMGTNQALPLMMTRLLPPGLLGLNLATIINVEDFDHEAIVKIMRMLCNTGTIPGDQLEAASPVDPTFWPIHPTIDRLFQWKKLQSNFGSEAWESPLGANLTKYCQIGGCEGHHAYDILPFEIYAMNSDSRQFEYVKMSNAELLDAANPTDSKLSYVYDNFQW